MVWLNVYRRYRGELDVFTLGCLLALKAMTCVQQQRTVVVPCLFFFLSVISEVCLKLSVQLVGRGGDRIAEEDNEECC